MVSTKSVKDHLGKIKVNAENEIKQKLFPNTSNSLLFNCEFTKGVCNIASAASGPKIKRQSLTILMNTATPSVCTNSWVRFQ